MRLQFFLMVVFFFILYSSSHFASIEAIIGDNVRAANENEFPFIVAIATYHDQTEIPVCYICGGSLISRKAVLSSEHCLDDEDLNGIQILVGSSYLDAALRYYPNWWISYNQWASLNYVQLEDEAFDLVIINLISRVPDYIQPPHISTSSRESLFGLEAKIAGWGLISNNTISNVLQVGTVVILTKEDCDNKVSEVAGEPIVSEIMTICSAANPYILLQPGDSGGPLFYNNLLIGINLGTSPHFEEFHPDEVNIHEHISFYYNFISDMRDPY